MNLMIFFAALRDSPDIFGSVLAPAQVNVMEAILDQTAGLPVPHVAYIMATAYHEPGAKSRMMPNREDLYYTTADRIARVWPKRFTRSTAKRFLRDPVSLANQVYNGRLGNRNGTDDGWTYRGGGLDHLTGRDHYQKLSAILGRNLVAEPDAILEPALAVKSLVHGMTTGRYTGKKLSDYGGRIHGLYDYTSARAIVNGDVKANGPLIGKYALAFAAALIAAGANEPRQTPSPPPAPPHPAPEPTPAPPAPAPAPVETVEPALVPALAAVRAIQILATGLSRLFRGRK